MDVSAALASLDLAKEEERPELGWLSASQQEPAPFWADLVTHVRRTAPALKSQPGVAYDLYHDAVLRHVTGATPAFVAFDRRSGWVALSFAELNARASACAAAWASQGLAPGAVIAIVLPLGIPWMVAFAAALRLGLVASFLDPESNAALVWRLDALAPARVVFDAAAPPPLGAWAAKLALIADPGRPALTPPHAYAPTDPCALLFSPLRKPLPGAAPTPVALAAEVAWQNALRDAVFVYRAAAGDRLAVPGFPLQQTQPAVILSALLAGAVFVHVPLANLATRPALLQEQPIATLGITPALRDLLIGTPTKLPALRQWLRSVDEPLDWTQWKRFVDTHQLEKTPTANVLIDAGAGGAVLFSTRRPGSLNAYAVPAAGRPYVLADATSGEPASQGIGVFAAKPDDPKKHGWFLLASRAGEFLWGATLEPRRAGRWFLAEEVEVFAAGLRGVVGAATVAVPLGDPGGSWAFVLVVFTGTNGGPKAGELQQAIRTELSADHVPDRVVTAPLYPRRKAGKVDVEWCRRQYCSGFLRRKTEHPAFLALAALRGFVLGQ